jgi:hypothetical protein
LEYAASVALAILLLPAVIAQGARMWGMCYVFPLGVPSAPAEAVLLGAARPVMACDVAALRIRAALAPVSVLQSHAAPDREPGGRRDRERLVVGRTELPMATMQREQADYTRARLVFAGMLAARAWYAQPQLVYSLATLRYLLSGAGGG